MDLRVYGFTDMALTDGGNHRVRRDIVHFVQKDANNPFVPIDIGKRQVVVKVAWVRMALAAGLHRVHTPKSTIPVQKYGHYY